jgi:putative ATP-dependent endonuclease of OLD family
VRISKVIIDNFRSIKSLEFEPGPLCTLIGENNSGKSTIMRALNLVLGEAWPSERSFDENDFHANDTSNPIEISVYFDQHWDETRNLKTNKVAEFKLRCKAYKKATKGKVAGELKTEYVCIGPKGGELSYPAAPGKFQGPQYPLNVNSDMRASVPLLYVDVMREYARQTPSSRWSVLRKLLDPILVGFVNDKTMVPFTQEDGTVIQLTRLQAFQRAIGSAYSYLRTPDFEQMESSLAANALDHMGLDPKTDGVSLQFSLHDPANAYKNLELLVEQLSRVSTAQDVGAGLQSAIVVAIFRTYEEMQKIGAIFAIEEPEAFLHPQKARYFSAVLERIANAGNQVFLSTHSPFFVKLHEPQTVAIVRRTEVDGTTVAQTTPIAITPDQKATLRMQTAVNVARAEMLFARRILLVEGDTELVALPFVFQQLGIDADREGITVVHCDGKEGIPFFAKIATAFDIPFVVLADIDDPTKPTQAKATAALQAVCPMDRLFLLKPDFESECGYKVSGGKAVSAHKHFSQTPPPAIPQTIVDATTKLQSI